LTVVAVRVLTIADYDQAMAVWQRSGLHSLRPSGRDSREAFAEQLTSGTQKLIGLELHGNLVGVVLTTHDGRKGWINRLAVLPELRRRGYAQQLVAEAERVLRSQGITVIAVLIEPDNQESLALFQQLGYAELPGMHYLSKRESADA